MLELKENQDVLVTYSMLTHRKNQTIYTVYINDVDNVSHILRLGRNQTDIFKNVVRAKFIDKTEKGCRIKIEDKIIEIYENQIKEIF